MTRDDIIRMARDAGYAWTEATALDFSRLSRFANLVAAAEREAIISLLKGIDETECESKDGYWETSFGAAFGKELLSTIRARG